MEKAHTDPLTPTKKGGPFGFWTSLKLWQKIIIALILGVVAGAVLGPSAEYIKPIGSLFINLIKMLIVPLIFSSLVVGICSMDDIKKMGRIGAKSFGIYLLTTAIAITIGLVIGTVLQPGAGLDMQMPAEMAAAKEAPSFIQTLLNMVPKNPVEAMASGSVLQIIVFALILGVAINLAGDKGKPVAVVFESFAEIMYKMTHIVMAFAPYGVFALMAWVAGKYGLDVLLPLGKVILGVYVGCILHVLLTLTLGGVMMTARLNPIRYWRGIIDAQAVAFTTTSSSGTLPVTMEVARTNLGVSKPISGFVLPLGATINMDGTALYECIGVIFLAQYYASVSDFTLTLGMQALVVVLALLASVGAAGIPSAGLVMMLTILAALGLPLEGAALLLAVDRPLDMMRTMVNVWSDSCGAAVIARTEGEEGPLAPVVAG